MPGDIEDELFVHPGEFRENIVKQAHDAGYGAIASGSSKKGHAHSGSHDHSHDHSARAKGHGHGHDDSDHTAVEHEHSHEESAGGHGGGEDGSMNMRGVFLHVLGDAVSRARLHCEFGHPLTA